MSTLQVANIHLESTGNNRIQYTGSNSFVFVTAGSNAMTINSTSISFTATPTFSSLTIGNSVITNTNISVSNVVISGSDIKLWGGFGGTNLATSVSNTVVGVGNSTAYVSMSATSGNPVLSLYGNTTFTPLIQYYVNNAAANTKYWRIWTSGSAQAFDVVDDGYTTSNSWMVATRSGMSISTVYFPGGNVGIGNTAPADKLHVQGNIIASGDITSAFSDERLKEITGPITNALEKVNSLIGFYYKPNETALQLHINDELKVGVSAQQVQKVLPEIVKPSAIDPKYLTVQYEKLVPLLIEAIKELTSRIEKLENGS